MAQTSTYSYTERKRIRKNFGNRDSVVEIPYLLQMQKDAYTAFLQAGIPPRNARWKACRPLLTPLSPSSRTTVSWK